MRRGERTRRPVLARKKTRHVRVDRLGLDVAASFRNKKRSALVPLPVGAHELERLCAPAGHDGLDWISGEQQARHHVDVAVSYGDHLDQGRAAVAAHVQLGEAAVLAAHVGDEHGDALSGSSRDGADLCGRQERADVVDGRQCCDWLLSDGGFKEIPHLLQGIAERLALVQERVCCRCSVMCAAFSSTRVPPMSIDQYMTRLVAHGHISSAAVVVASVYLQRCIASSKLRVTVYSVHRVVFAAFVCATKYVDDFVVEDRALRKAGGVTFAEFGALERMFAGDVLGWRLYVDLGEFAVAAEDLRGGANHIKR